MKAREYLLESDRVQHERRVRNRLMLIAALAIFALGMLAGHYWG